MLQEIVAAAIWYVAIVGAPLLMFFWLAVHAAIDAVNARRDERDRQVEEANAAGEELPPRRSTEIRKVIITLPATVIRARRAERGLVRTAPREPEAEGALQRVA